MWLFVSGAGEHMNTEFSEIKNIPGNIDRGSISKKSVIKVNIEDCGKIDIGLATP